MVFYVIFSNSVAAYCITSYTLLSLHVVYLKAKYVYPLFMIDVGVLHDLYFVVNYCCRCV